MKIVSDLNKQTEILMKEFETKVCHKSLKIERQEENMWKHFIFYKSHETNELFLAFRDGYYFGRYKG